MKPKIHSKMNKFNQLLARLMKERREKLLLLEMKEEISHLHYRH